ncbi:MAG: urea ABC transporter ATP-binding subunit UrtE [Candidatus Muproteobacteria bacterium RBG_16_60_9]|uniref:Urea ABC transporter ATP-binding subunit UrtE n=1 Tax=Candidatus Muproteobacteria bacterium RBG_16_60_9 TaxID=1817755 RepID=A0A1F6VJG6_9PROT|nr:MAG: urea ABC transporter ATP-binding subunit UrtE [Candidatus Muproteobacteria bacterium RBG_16_60_9]
MLRIEKLNHYYGSSLTLNNLSFEVPNGSCTAVLGRNGVGKSTLLKCLMGVLRIRSGAITFDGHDITAAPPHVRARHGIGYVPQGREIFARLTVEENLLTGLAAPARTIPAEIYEMFPVLAEMRRRRGGDLSGGQQQQLAIARALLTKPKLLILDEPTEGIQPSIIKDIERVIRQLTEGKEMAILLVEQYFDFAKALADQYIVMSRGEIVARGAGNTMDENEVRRYLSV